MIKETKAKVISRIDGEECDLVWIGVTEDYLDESYGAPCSVIVRHFELTRKEYQDESTMLAKNKKRK